MDTGNYFQSVLSLLFVLGLIGGLALLAKHFGLAQAVPRLGKSKRISVVEGVNVDAKHKVVLIRRDNVEHLLMIGPTSDLLIETGIPARLDTDQPTPNPSQPISKNIDFQTKDDS